MSDHQPASIRNQSPALSYISNLSRTNSFNTKRNKHIRSASMGSTVPETDENATRKENLSVKGMDSNSPARHRRLQSMDGVQSSTLQSQEKSFPVPSMRNELNSFVSHSPPNLHSRRRKEKLNRHDIPASSRKSLAQQRLSVAAVSGSIPLLNSLKSPTLSPPPSAKPMDSLSILLTPLLIHPLPVFEKLIEAHTHLSSKDHFRSNSHSRQSSPTSQASVKENTDTYVMDSESEDEDAPLGNTHTTRKVNPSRLSAFGPPPGIQIRTHNTRQENHQERNDGLSSSFSDKFLKHKDSTTLLASHKSDLNTSAQHRMNQNDIKNVPNVCQFIPTVLSYILLLSPILLSQQNNDMDDVPLHDVRSARTVLWNLSHLMHNVVFEDSLKFLVWDMGQERADYFVAALQTLTVQLLFLLKQLLSEELILNSSDAFRSLVSLTSHIAKLLLGKSAPEDLSSVDAFLKSATSTQSQRDDILHHFKQIPLRYVKSVQLNQRLLLAGKNVTGTSELEMGDKEFDGQSIHEYVQHLIPSGKDLGLALFERYMKQQRAPVSPENTTRVDPGWKNTSCSTTESPKQQRRNSHSAKSPKTRKHSLSVRISQTASGDTLVSPTETVSTSPGPKGRMSHDRAWQPSLSRQNSVSLSQLAIKQTKRWSKMLIDIASNGSLPLSPSKTRPDVALDMVEMVKDASFVPSVVSSTTPTSVNKKGDGHGKEKSLLDQINDGLRITSPLPVKLTLPFDSPPSGIKSEENVQSFSTIKNEMGALEQSHSEKIFLSSLSSEQILSSNTASTLNTNSQLSALSSVESILSPTAIRLQHVNVISKESAKPVPTFDSRGAYLGVVIYGRFSPMTKVKADALSRDSIQVVGDRLYRRGLEQVVLVLEMTSKNHLQVIAGALDRLFMLLASESPQDSDYIDTFLLSHTLFMSSRDLLDALRKRFALQPPENPSSEDLDHFREWRKPIQFKVLSVIARWIRLQWQDFGDDQYIMTTLESFLQDAKRQGFRREADKIRKIARRDGEAVFVLQQAPHLSFLRTEEQVKSRFKDQSRVFVLTESASPIRYIDAEPLAQYLTASTFFAFEATTNRDIFFRTTPARHRPKTTTDSIIDQMAERSNRLRTWIALEICSVQSLTERKKLIEKFLTVAKYCLSYRDFNTALFITSGLLSMPVQRLKKTWNMVSSAHMTIMTALEHLIDVSGNMKNYRAKLAQANSPFIPFLPLLMKDISFAQEGISDDYHDSAWDASKNSHFGDSTKDKVPLIHFDKCTTLKNLVEKGFEGKKDSHKYTFLDEWIVPLKSLEDQLWSIPTHTEILRDWVPPSTHVNKWNFLARMKLGSSRDNSVSNSATSLSKAELRIRITSLVESRIWMVEDTEGNDAGLTYATALSKLVEH